MRTSASPPIFVITIILLLVSIAPAQSQLNGLDTFVAKVQKAFEVPGIAVAVVKDGKVLVAKGYGVRKLGEPAPVDERTLFGIASNSKAFTATALGILVEEGKVEWDAPVIRYLPWFRLSDPYVTAEMTVRDLLVHRSGLGLGSGDLLWWPASTYTRPEIARRLQYLPLVRSFRSAYAYDNVLYLIAGELIQAVSGQSWEDFISTRILAKVGMTDSKPRHSDAAGGGNVAATHAKVDGKVRPIAPFTSDNTNPAGGINSSARDMAKWLITQLDSGRTADGTRLFSPRTTSELWNIVTPLRPGNPAPELSRLRANFSGYALGFGVRDYRGYKFVSHTGGLPGYVSIVGMIPELRLGVAVLTNQESGEAFDAILFHILDQFTAGPATDWLSAFKKVQERSEAAVAVAEQGTAAKRDSISHPSLPLASYAGTYSDTWYGDITITLENGTLVMRFDRTPSLVGDLVHWQYDTFVVRWRDRELRADAFVTFALTPEGAIEQAKMKAVSPATDFSFDFQDLLLKPSKKSGQ